MQSLKDTPKEEISLELRLRVVAWDLFAMLYVLGIRSVESKMDYDSRLHYATRMKYLFKRRRVK